MSWLYSRALVEEYSEENYLDGEQSAQSSGKPIPQAYCAPDKMMDFSKVSRFGMTFKPLMESRGEALLMSYLAGFHAKTSAQQEREQESTESDQECGEKWRGWLAKYDPNMSLWRTAQCSLIEDLNESLETLPKSGMTRNGLLWELPMLAQIIKGTESGSLAKHSLPTPTCNPHMPNKNANTTGPKNLVEVAQGKWEHLMPKKQMFLTPRVVEVDESPENFRRRMNSKRPNDRKNGYGSLTMQVKAMTWPTPDANCGMRGTQPNWTPKRKSGHQAQYSINQAVRDSEQNNGGKLNPTWVEWLMGWPLGWTDLKPLEMDKSHCVQPQHGES